MFVFLGVKLNAMPRVYSSILKALLSCLLALSQNCTAVSWDAEGFYIISLILCGYWPSVPVCVSSLSIRQQWPIREPMPRAICPRRLQGGLFPRARTLSAELSRIVKGRVKERHCAPYRYIRDVQRPLFGTIEEAVWEAPGSTQ